MTPTPHPAISEAREALNRLARHVMPELNSPNGDRFNQIYSALDLAESQAVEIEQNGREIQHWFDLAGYNERGGGFHSYKEERDSLTAQVVGLTAERDEALSRLLSAGFEKPTAEDMDWAISLSASLRMQEVVAEQSKMDRLKAALMEVERDEWKASPADMGRQGIDLMSELSTSQALLAECREVLHASLRPIGWQDVRLAVGEGKLTNNDVLDGVNAEMRRRASLIEKLEGWPNA